MAKNKRDVRAELQQLPLRTVNELAKKYQELFGRPTKSRNKPNLIKQLAWRIQELDEGGLSERAVRRIAELGDRLPPSWQRKASQRQRRAAAQSRDPRLPPPGTKLSRTYGGVEHTVKVLQAGFEFQGELFDSLSTIAKRITGKSWNGYKFFELLKEGA